MLATNPGFMVFWIGVVAVGLVVPLILTLCFRNNNKGVFNVATISLVSTIIGGIAFRAMMYILGSGFNLSL